MARVQRAMAVLLTLQAPLAQAQQPQPITIPQNLTPVQRQQLIRRCREHWQDWCSQLGLSNPTASMTSDAASTQQQDPRQQCYVQWQQYCTRYNIPNPAEAHASEQAPPDPKKIIRQCRQDWRPECERYGISRPEEPPPPPIQIALPPPVPVGPSPFECEFDWNERCGTEAQAVQSLFEHGPSGVTFPDPAKFSATGFIRSGWPIVVRYQIPAGARATLTITPQYGRGGRFKVMLPSSVDGSPQTYAFVAQVEGSDGNLLVADYKITARYFVKGAKDPVAPVQVLSFGAGDRAATTASADRTAAIFNAAYGIAGADARSQAHMIRASFAAEPDYSQPVAINDVKFTPPIVERPVDNGTVVLTYSYILKNDWDRVAEDLWRACSAVLRCNLYHPQRPYAPTSQGRRQWQWFVNRGTPLGIYQLVVRAWRTCGATVDPSLYAQCGNSADWVIGSAGPISVATQ